MNQLYADPTPDSTAVPANQSRFTNEQKIARLFTGGNMDSLTPYNEQVVVIVPSGSACEPRELGHYKNIQIAFQIVKSLDLHEYRMFSLESGNEVFVQ